MPTPMLLSARLNWNRVGFGSGPVPALASDDGGDGVVGVDGGGGEGEGGQLTFTCTLTVVVVVSTPFGSLCERIFLA